MGIILFYKEVVKVTIIIDKKDGMPMIVLDNQYKGSQKKPEKSNFFRDLLNDFKLLYQYFFEFDE